ncbi:MAG TPA: nicotinamide riboside transporter PnuC [Lentimicrobium sp.]|nr:nicotinamide riboside transporter PnuC [Lentimicrobium sp.]
MDFFNQFYENLLNTSLLEFIAVITGIGSVWYAQRENILVYPVGIISVLIYVYICYISRLYADAGINLFYFIVSVYGWYHWTHKNGKTENREISVNSRIEQLLGVGLVVLGFFVIIGLIWIFNHHDRVYMNSFVPFLDSFITSIFLVGMWLMALKRVENWIYWIVGDIIAIPLYYSKGLVFTGFQYIVFLVIAVLGYIEWKKRWQESQLNA